MRVKISPEFIERLWYGGHPLSAALLPLISRPHIERNVAVRMRDGVRIYVDIYRPDGAAGERNLPAILGWSPYGKHNLSSRLIWPEAGVAELDQEERATIYQQAQQIMRDDLAYLRGWSLLLDGAPQGRTGAGAVAPVDAPGALVNGIEGTVF